ncbi:DUF3883 domain-containing protein [Herbaspirillum chlorophenolicum]|uniref:DUF3883 domain-containing protein n=1 Tax=Herbaspirillum chlorophenolicum TaxID=211589 RepID=A0ABW8F1W3_9BURK
MANDWSDEEVRATIASYFDMLAREAHQQAYKKSDYNTELRQKLVNRSEGAIEWKHQNVSAVLENLGLPFINGYKPRHNVQSLLRQEIENYIRSNSKQIEEIVDAMEEMQEPHQQTFEGVLVDPPAASTINLNLDKTRSRFPLQIDYAARDESNRQLGRAGEQWVLEYEKKRLLDDGLPELVVQVDWVADRIGDGLGYDILSFDAADIKRFIEVKTTNGLHTSSFVISRSELDFSREAGPAFWLYRVFQYRKSPRLYILRGDLSKQLHMEPMSYRASFTKLIA